MYIIVKLVAIVVALSTLSEAAFWDDRQPLLDPIPASRQLNYAPYLVTCPSQHLIRSGPGLSPEERDYLDGRELKTEEGLFRLLESVGIPNFDYAEFMNRKSRNIKIALGFSGGGYRSMLTGAGVLEAYDIRSSRKSNLAGLLQATTYNSGISGGSWIVMSSFVNDFRPISEIKEDKSAWSLELNLLEGIPEFEAKSFTSHEKDVLLAHQSPLMQNLSSNAVEDLSDIPVATRFFAQVKKIFGWGNNSKVQDSRQGATGHWSPMQTLTSILKNRNHSSNPEQRKSLKKIFAYYTELHIEVREKRTKGFHLSLTDYWGRALARKIFPMASRSPGLTVSDCTRLPSFVNYDQPIPIICAVGRIPGQLNTNSLPYNFEFSPFEFGSWDSQLSAFIPLRYLGSKLFNGAPTKKIRDSGISICTSGFDEIGFITATSSSLFNHIFFYLGAIILELELGVSIAVNKILKSFGLDSGLKSLQYPQLHPDYALYSPNPFYGYDTAADEIASNEHLYLVDGGDDGQNIPFHPFLRHCRETDIVIAFDMTADHGNYPDGSVLTFSADRFHDERVIKDNATFVIDGKLFSVFPKVPGVQEFLETKLNERPVFFGCDLKVDYPTFQVNQTMASNDYLPPLVVYTANMGLTYPSNTSTFKLSYNLDEMNGMIDNGYNIATYLDSPEYLQCLVCATLKREFDRINLGINSKFKQFEVPPTCQSCYKKYCWHESQYRPSA